VLALALVLALAWRSERLRRPAGALLLGLYPVVLVLLVRS
jgi:Ca2+/Na+ antiporter